MKFTIFTVALISACLGLAQAISIEAQPVKNYEGFDYYNDPNFWKEKEANPTPVSNDDFAENAMAKLSKKDLALSWDARKTQDKSF